VADDKNPVEDSESQSYTDLARAGCGTVIGLSILAGGLSGTCVLTFTNLSWPLVVIGSMMLAGAALEFYRLISDRNK
jgi:hypothetical protein